MYLVKPHSLIAFFPDIKNTLKNPMIFDLKRISFKIISDPDPQIKDPQERNQGSIWI